MFSKLRKYQLNVVTRTMLSNNNNLIVFAIGCCLNIFAYVSLKPFIASILFYFFGAFLLNVFLMRNNDSVYEHKMFCWVFVVCWFMAGISAIYTNYLASFSQYVSDADTYYFFSKNYQRKLFPNDFNGYGMILGWQLFYKIFSIIGLDGKYIGILVNTSFVAFTGVVAMKIARLIYGNDKNRLNRLIILFSTCGLFWLFAAIHLRDAAILLLVTFIIYVCTYFVKNRNIVSLLFLLVVTVVSASILLGLRKQFVFIPYIMACISVFVCLFTKGKKFIKKRSVFMSSWFYIIICLFIAATMMFLYYEYFVRVVNKYLFSRAYATTTLGVAPPDSLGVVFLITAPLLVRFIIGSFSLYLMPIPLWQGLQTLTAYGLFKSCFAVYNYMLLPLVGVSVQQIMLNKLLRTPELMLQLVIMIIFTSVVTLFSLEFRHFGVFYVSILQLALLPDLSIRKNRNVYILYLSIFIVTMIVIHGVWLYLKM